MHIGRRIPCGDRAEPCFVGIYRCPRTSVGQGAPGVLDDAASKAVKLELVLYVHPALVAPL